MARSPKQHFPQSIADEYTRYVLRYLDVLRDKMLKDLNTYIDKLDSFRIDAEDPFEPLWQATAVLINEAFNNPVFAAGITEFGHATKFYNDGSYTDDIYKIIGFNDVSDLKMKKMLDTWTTKNVRLIKDIPEDNIRKIQRLFYDAVEDGTPRKEIVDEVKKIIGNNDARAKLITDDQIGKLNGNIDRLKNKESGIKKFTWRTVGDSAVRAKHRQFNDKIYTWEKGAPGGIFPGQEIRCRCFGEPILDEIFGEGYLKEIGLESSYEQAEWLVRENAL